MSSRSHRLLVTSWSFLGFLWSLGPTSQPAGKHLDRGARVVRTNRGGAQRTHSGDKAVIAVLLSIEDPALDEDRDGPQHKRYTNRFMWMKLRVQCSFLRPRAGKTDALK